MSNLGISELISSVDGKRVIHNRYGGGVIDRYDIGGYIIVKHDGGYEKKYPFPDIFYKGFLTFEDTSLLEFYSIKMNDKEESAECNIINHISSDTYVNLYSMIKNYYPGYERIIKTFNEYQAEDAINLLVSLSEYVWKSKPDMIRYTEFLSELTKSSLLVAYYSDVSMKKNPVYSQLLSVYKGYVINESNIDDSFYMFYEETPYKEFAGEVLRESIITYLRHSRESIADAEIDGYIISQIEKRGITRLCHMTQINKIASILSDDVGIKSSVMLEDSVIKNDRDRFDKHTDYVSCSLEYPNYRYYQNKKYSDSSCDDWAVIFISPNVIAKTDTLYCRYNAAESGGKILSHTHAEWYCMFLQKIVKYYYMSTNTRVSLRTTSFPDWLTTYDQAEIMPYKNVSIDNIIGIAFDSEETLVKVKQEMDNQKIRYPKLYIAPDLFTNIRARLEIGERPTEILYDGGNIYG